MNKFLIAGLVVCVVATLACIISTSIPYWVYQHSEQSGTETSVAIGLWKVCSRIKTGSTVESKCRNYEAPSWLKAVQAMMVLGVLLLALSSTLAASYLWKFSTNNLVYFGTVFTAAFGGVVVIIGFAVFANKIDLGTSHFSGGFYLAVFTAILAFVAASLFAISRRSSGGYNTI